MTRLNNYLRSMRIYKDERRVINAAMAWQEYNDRIGSKWVRGSAISKMLAACRRLRRTRQP